MLDIARNPCPACVTEAANDQCHRLLEVDGMVAAVDAADAMLKAASVRLLGHQVRRGYNAGEVEGRIWRRGAATDAGRRRRAGRVISRKGGRPEEDAVAGWRVLRVRQRRLKAPQVPATPEFMKRYWRCWHPYAGNDGGRGWPAHFGWPLGRPEINGTTLF